MDTVLLCAIGVGGATILGGALGLFFSKITKPVCDAVLSLAAGVMLSASIFGLIIPSIEQGNSIFTTIFGLFCGAFCVQILDFLLLRITKSRENSSCVDNRAKSVILFISAIALHNLPEGVAAGVGFGTDDISNGILIATAIALQNIPEGIIVTVSLIGIGAKQSRAFIISALTGVIEIIGTFIGYFAVMISSALLPFILALAGGTMIYVICEEMIPETHSENGGISSYFLLFGFSLMLFINAVL